MLHQESLLWLVEVVESRSITKPMKFEIWILIMTMYNLQSLKWLKLWISEDSTYFITFCGRVINLQHWVAGFVFVRVLVLEVLSFVVCSVGWHVVNLLGCSFMCLPLSLSLSFFLSFSWKQGSEHAFPPTPQSGGGGNRWKGARPQDRRRR